jgi:hypothetical protein
MQANDIRSTDRFVKGDPSEFPRPRGREGMVRKRILGRRARTKSEGHLDHQASDRSASNENHQPIKYLNPDSSLPPIMLQCVVEFRNVSQRREDERDRQLSDPAGIGAVGPFYPDSEFFRQAEGYIVRPCSIAANHSKLCRRSRDSFRDRFNASDPSDTVWQQVKQLLFRGDQARARENQLETGRLQ